jgi:hypothetical protein
MAYLSIFKSGHVSYFISWGSKELWQSLMVEKLAFPGLVQELYFPGTPQKDKGPCLKASLISGSFMGLKAHAPSVRL